MWIAGTLSLADLVANLLRQLQNPQECFTFGACLLRSGPVLRDQRLLRLPVETLGDAGKDEGIARMPLEVLKAFEVERIRGVVDFHAACASVGAPAGCCGFM